MGAVGHPRQPGSPAHGAGMNENSGMKICRISSRLPILFSLLFTASAFCLGAETTASHPPQTTPPAGTEAASAAATTSKRPRIGLVLSGGGARGLAHVGVLKVLEREGIAINAIAGTSMGAIIGGLYASGMSAQQMEAVLLKVQWERVFAARVERPYLSQRRKEEDFEISSIIELGFREGELRLPLGAISGRGLESLLRHYTLRVSQVDHFDALPIPFRAVATDMENGQPVVMAQGDLALAMRSSMSVPGVFAPTERDGRILGDGGLVNNLPVDVARAMGVDVVIAVNIGTPLSPREALGSATGLTSQMLNILTEQNVQRSLAQLKPQDVLVQPALGKFTSSDFNETAALIALGEDGALSVLTRLQALALAPEAYAQWRLQQPGFPRLQGKITRITFEGSTETRPERLLHALETQPGQVFDLAKVERDTQRLAATGDYRRADFELRPDANDPVGNTLVFDLEDKPWGPHYIRVGLDLSTNFSGDSAFNLKISHNRHRLDQHGSEWRNRIQLGEVPRWTTELYRPLGWRIAGSLDWFVAGWALAERRKLNRFDNPSKGELLARYDRRTERVGLDFGQPWGRFGEVRLGWNMAVVRDTPELVSAASLLSTDRTTGREMGGRLRIVVDQLDDVNFPRRGYRLNTELWTGRQRTVSTGGKKEDVRRLELEAQSVGSWNQHTLNAYTRIQTTDKPLPSGLGRYGLGGFQQLSGYEQGQLEGNTVLFGRLVYYHRLSSSAVLTRGSFLGTSVEIGNTWQTQSQVELSGLRKGGSLFYAADTGIGPFYLGLTYSDRRKLGVYLFIGRP
jgi:NTE family protein